MQGLSDQTMMIPVLLCILPISIPASKPNPGVSIETGTTEKWISYIRMPHPSFLSKFSTSVISEDPVAVALFK